MARTMIEPASSEGGNRVELRGKVSGSPEERTLPSGDSVWVFRVVVPRDEPRGRATVDTIDCAVWSGRARRTAAGLCSGDLVVLTGALRRRFFRAGAATASRVEVEVAALKVLQRGVTRRAASA